MSQNTVLPGFEISNGSSVHRSMGSMSKLSSKTKKMFGNDWLALHNSEKEASTFPVDLEPHRVL